MADYTLFKWVFDLTFVPDTADYFSCKYRETGAVLVGSYLASVLAFFQNRCLFCPKTWQPRFSLYSRRLWEFALATFVLPPFFDLAFTDSTAPTRPLYSAGAVLSIV